MAGGWVGEAGMLSAWSMLHWSVLPSPFSSSSHPHLNSCTTCNYMYQTCSRKKIDNHDIIILILYNIELFRATLWAVPRSFWFSLNANTGIVEPLNRTVRIVTSNHFAIFFPLTQTPDLIVRVLV